MAIKVVALATVQSGKDDAFIEAARACVAASRAESGLIGYDLWREQGGERRFVFDEMYRDQAAVDAHMGSAHFAAFAGALGDIVVPGGVTIAVTEAVDVA